MRIPTVHLNGSSGEESTDRDDRDEAAAASADHWERLADEAAAQAQWNRDRGIDLSKPGMSAGDYQAADYRRTAKALRLEAATGRAHCSLCLKDHPNHHHGHRG